MITGEHIQYVAELERLCCERGQTELTQRATIAELRAALTEIAADDRGCWDGAIIKAHIARAALEGKS
jgi:hypothetical protein